MGVPYHAVRQGAPLLEVAAETLVCGFKAEAADEEFAELLGLLWRLWGRGCEKGGTHNPPAPTWDPLELSQLQGGPGTPNCSPQLQGGPGTPSPPH